MTGDERLMHLERIVEEHGKTQQGHMLETARVMAQIPLQLEALKEGTAGVRDEIKGAREEIKGVRDTLERHSSRILTLEQEPDKRAAELQKSIGKQLMESVIRWGVPALVALVTAFLATSGGWVEKAPAHVIGTAKP